MVMFQRGGVYNVRHVVFGHVVLFVLFLAVLSQDTLFGLERFVSAFLVSGMLTYGITENPRKSLTVAIVFTALVSLIDPRGPFMDIRRPFDQFQKDPTHFDRVRGPLALKYGGLEQFDNKDEMKGEDSAIKSGIKPAGDSEMGSDDSIKAVADGNTTSTSTLNLDDDELDNILGKDDEKDEIAIETEKKGVDKHSEEFGEGKNHAGGLDELTRLMNMAKKEAREPDMKLDKPAGGMTPAQAQRETFRLIDTVKQLKETMESMGPTLKAGRNIISMYKALNMEGL